MGIVKDSPEKKSNEINIDYIIITAAWNEEQFIEKTIKSVVAQTVLPKKWIIVSDGSTDRTDEIVLKYAKVFTWIELVRIPIHPVHNFASKVYCFRSGYEKVRSLGFDVIVNLDADISFEPDYFEFILEKLKKNPKLGVAGTPFIEDGHRYDYRFTSINHVSGACQLFRRQCFEDIGGYVPIKMGGIDWVAVTTARMKGWETRTFPEKVCYHHRKIGTAGKSVFVSIFDYGRKNYFLGYHPLWQFFRAVYQMMKKPIFLGGILLWVGYVWGFLTIRNRPVSPELVTFYRREQMERLRSIMINLLNPRKLKKDFSRK